jgi:hypothetical protein
MNELTATTTAQTQVSNTTFNILDLVVGGAVFAATGLILRALKVKKISS